MKHPESVLQRAIIKYLGEVGIWAVHVPNGSKLAGSPEQRARTGARLKADGLAPGFPDLVLYAADGRVGHIEVKSERGYHEVTQKACQSKLEALGHRYAVCRSLEDVEETLEQWGWL